MVKISRRRKGGGAAGSVKNSASAASGSSVAASTSAAVAASASAVVEVDLTQESDGNEDDIQVEVIQPVPSGSTVGGQVRKQKKKYFFKKCN